MKNHLQVLSTLIRLEAMRAGSELARDRFAILAERVDGLALIHEQLYRVGNFTRVDLRKYLRDVAGGLAGLFKGVSPVGIDIAAAKLWCDPALAVPIGMIVSELLTNAFKHAFPDGRSGRIRVSLARCRDSVRLTVADNGVGGSGPGPAEQKGQGLGTRLVEGLANQIGARLERCEGPGCKIVLTFPRHAFSDEPPSDQPDEPSLRPNMSRR